LTWLGYPRTSYLLEVRENKYEYFWETPELLITSFQLAMSVSDPAIEPMIGFLSCVTYRTIAVAESIHHSFR
jgi:hypothetical protein